MSRLREASRLARRVPGVRRVIEASDPQRRASFLARLDIVDTALYAAQLGVPSITAEEAARHYATQGFARGLTLNVLFDPYVIRENLMKTPRPVLYDYFNSGAWHAETSGVFSAAAYRESTTDWYEHPTGPVGHLWSLLQADPTRTLTVLPGGAREIAWADLYPVLFDATVEWARLRRDRVARYPRAALEHPRTMDRPEGAALTAPLTSIVMPVWNRPAGLRRAVDSVLAQDWEHWELLIVDDGSWDDTLAVADLLASRDPRIRVVRREHAGVCAARNAGIAQARGDYIAFLDSDNAWEPAFLGDIVSAMRTQGLEAAYATIEMRSEGGLSYRYGAPAKESLLNGNSIDLNTLVAGAALVRDVGGFDESLPRAVDYDLILKLADRTDIVHVPTLGAVYDNSESADDRISTTEAFGWNTVVRLRHGAPVPVARRRKGTSIIALVQRNDLYLDRRLDALMAVPGKPSVQLVGVGLKPDQWRMLRVSALGRTGVSAQLLQDGEPYAYAVDLAAARADRHTLVVIDPRSTFTPGDVAALAAAAQEPGVAAMPLTVADDGTVATIGAAVAGPHRLPVLPLAGHPVEDARRIGESITTPALAGRTFAVATERFHAAGGIDPLLFDAFELIGLSRRLAAGAPESQFRALPHVAFVQSSPAIAFTALDERGTQQVLQSTAPAHPDDPAAFYGPSGLTVAHWRTRSIASDLDDPPAPAPPEPMEAVVVRERRTTLVDGREVPRLRWAIKTAAPAGPKGQSWGDTHFAHSLAAALESLGQDTVVDAREASRRSTDYLDDVTLVLRGLDDIETPPASLAFLWVISHPDMVTRREAARFDRVFAASTQWSADASRRWGLAVDPLLQCTDPERFHPTAARRGDDIVFVGNSRGIPRPTVLESVRAGIPLKLYGGDWDRFIPAAAVTAPSIDNRLLGRTYGSASVVLNDHWADMQREGFISNRLFDVVAAGGRVISDEVSGIDEIFGGAVRTYRAVEQIAPLLTGDRDALFADETELAAIGARIRTEHSFAARARVLLDAAVESLGLAP